MTALNLTTSEMLPPFVVFDGTKITTAKQPERTLAHKYRNWRNSKPGRTGRMTFQKKHCFDADITIMWLQFLLDVLYPGKKVGLSMDKAPQHNAEKVQVYIKKMYDEGRLVLEFIDGGLTSVIQVCDLEGNKPLKVNIKRRYLKYRADYIKSERARYPDEPNRRVQMKMPVVDMMEIIESSVKEFNLGQRETRSVEKTFISAGQHPWRDCKKQFKKHLDYLSTLPLYGGCKCSVTEALMDKPIEDKAELALHPGPDAVKVMLADDDAEQEDGEAGKL